MTILTERLLLRTWRESDLAPFAELNADPVVMEHFPATMTREESDAMVARIEASHAENGHCFYAAELRATGEFMGFIGLHRPVWEAHFTPCVEIGWRLARPFWGLGYASEGARVALRHGFDVLGLDEIVAVTVPANERSQAVMRRLGMTRDPADDFDHPRVPQDCPQVRHVLYRLRREQWAAQTGTVSASALR